MTLRQERGTQAESNRFGEVKQQKSEFMERICGAEYKRKGSCIENDLQKSSGVS